MFGGSYPAGCSSTPYDEDDPLVCPQCGGANHDEETDAPIFEADPAFCSAACRDRYALDRKAEAEAEAAAFALEMEMDSVG